MGRNKINKDIYGAHITNNSNYSGIFDLPEVCCFPSSIPDYLCLYSEFKNYHKTEKTCVCFFQEDKIFDGQNGIFNSIIYKNEKALNRIKERFSGINYFISPDYSM
ncbi:hypothetical protein FACS189459_7040 [Bacilli bacterium]|nr:hypothetical protein FACS189459_7040 [Bacilli bacterium]